MEILSYGSCSDGIEALWASMAVFGGFVALCILVYILAESGGWLSISILVLFILVALFGIFGLTNLTPHYNYIKVSTKQENFDINSIVDKYNITDVDGYIMTLQEKEPIN